MLRLFSFGQSWTKHRPQKGMLEYLMFKFYFRALDKKTIEKHIKKYNVSNESEIMITCFFF